jgi:hypothetical protein
MLSRIAARAVAGQGHVDVTAQAVLTDYAHASRIASATGVGGMSDLAGHPDRTPVWLLQVRGRYSYVVPGAGTPTSFSGAVVTLLLNGVEPTQWFDIAYAFHFSDLSSLGTVVIL